MNIELIYELCFLNKEKRLLFIGKEFPFHTIHLLIKCIAKKYSILFVKKNISINEVESIFFQNRLFTDFDQSILYVISISKLEQISILNDTISACYYLKENKAQYFNIEKYIVESTDIRYTINTISEILFLFEDYLHFYINDIFSVYLSISLESIAYLMTYAECIQKRVWIDFLLSHPIDNSLNKSSLYDFIESLFLKKKKDAEILWVEIKKKYNDELILNFISDAFWQAFLLLQSYIEKTIFPKEFLRKLPYSFINNYSKKYEIEVVVNGLKKIYREQQDIKLNYSQERKNLTLEKVWEFLY